MGGRAGDAGSVPVRPVVPLALKTRLFTLAEARGLGLTRGQLRGASYRRMGSGFYRWVGLQESPLPLLSAVARRLPAGAAFSGCTAAWLQGLDVAPCEPVEVTIPQSVGSLRCSGAFVRRAALGSEEIVRRRGLPTTSALRTVVDLAGRDPLTEGVVAADLFLHARLVTMTRLRSYIAAHPGAKVSPGCGVWWPWRSPRRSPRWRVGFGCSSCSPDFRDLRFRFRSMTTTAVSWAVRISFIRMRVWRSSTTAATTEIGWSMTIAVRIAWSAPAFVSFASPPWMCSALPIQLPRRCGTPSPRRI